MGKDTHDRRRLVIEALSAFADYLLAEDTSMMSAHARLLATGKTHVFTHPRDTRIPTETMIALGVHPWDMIDRYNAYPSTTYEASSDNGLGDPLQIAAMFAVFGETEQAKKMLRIRQLVVDTFVLKKEAEKPAVRAWSIKNGVYRSTASTWITAFNPEDYGIKKLEYYKNVDSLYTAAWFNTNIVRAIIDAYHSYSAINLMCSLQNQGLATQKQVQAVARHYLEEAVRVKDRKRTDYVITMRLLKHCSEETAQWVYDRFPATGEVLRMSRRDASEEDYMKGLRALQAASVTTTRIVLANAGRLPRLDELKQLRGKGLVRILSLLPWSHLSGLIKQHGEAPFKAMLLANLSDVSAMQAAVSNNKERVILKEETPLKISPNTTVYDWERVYSRLYKLYCSSIALRNKLHELCGNEKVAYLFVLNAMKPSEELTEILKLHPAYSSVMELREAYTFDPDPRWAIA